MTITDILPDAATAPAGGDEATARAAHIAGLRALADAMETHPDVPLPFHGRLDPVTLHFLRDSDPVPAMTDAATAFGGPWRQRTRDYTDTGGCAYFDLLGEFHGLQVKLTAYRDAACEQDGGQWRPRPAIAAVLTDAAESAVAA
jgi:hypothetical protein